MKLWKKDGVGTLDKIESFTIGNDRTFDTLLARYDIIGTRAHITMLQSIGILSDEELQLLNKELLSIQRDIEAGTFAIDPSCEDIHSQIEMMLTARLGNIGKKVHTGRSRNDQIVLDIKLYLRDEILAIRGKTTELFNLLIALSETHKHTLMPGYTHLQVAMPSSFGLWFGAYAESLVDDMQLLKTSYAIANKNPLGSGAGYGSSFPLNRQMTTELMGFKSMHYNSIYAQMSRGKTEKFVAIALAAISATLSKLSMDVCLYMGQNFKFISFPDNMTTGSSIMPHKKNPDVFELIRGKCNRIQSIPNELALLCTNLPAGYHREMQLTKEILFPAIEALKSCIDMACLMLREIQVKSNILDDEHYKYIFTVEKINELVNKNIAFRDAYRQVADEVQSGIFSYSGDTLQHTHEGSIGNLCNNEIKEMYAISIANW
jgi:argininosuccinate lyase